MTKTILVIVASEGIGFETARLSAGRGGCVLTTAGNAERLVASKARIGGAVETAAVDFSDPEALDAFLAAPEARGHLPDGLVNNRQGSSGTFEDADWSKLAAMLRLNVSARAAQSLDGNRHETERIGLYRQPFRRRRHSTNTPFSPMPPARLSVGDAPGDLGLMADDIDWVTMWHYKVDGGGFRAVAEGLPKPFTAEWSSFTMQPAEYVAEADTTVSFGRFTGAHAALCKLVDAAYAPDSTVRDNKIQRLRQYYDTLAVAEARI